jgi:hypothetical protein
VKPNRRVDSSTRDDTKKGDEDCSLRHVITVIEFQRHHFESLSSLPSDPLESTKTHHWNKTKLFENFNEKIQMRRNNKSKIKKFCSKQDKVI